MFNHQGLLSENEIKTVQADRLRNSTLAQLPTPEVLAEQIVQQLQARSPNAEILLADDHGAEFNNNIILESRPDGIRHAIHIDPMARSAYVVRQLEQPYKLQPLLNDIKNIQLSENPYQRAMESVPTILSELGLDASSQTKPIGWCKLNFLANVDGQPARVTYVLRDGHVDVTKYEGRSEMSTREFFLRLHTSHGQPPHWNGRMAWSLILDAMAIAMVTWGMTGLIMWWQIKRTRRIGGVVLALSAASAIWLYFGMVQFYATTKL